VPFEAVIAGIVTETLTFDDPPDALALPIPPTDDEAELVLADELAEVPMLFRLDPPPWPMPTDDEPDVDPDDELAVVSACAACPMQNKTAHAIWSVVLVMMLLRKEREREAEAIP
jgi:hypothetical protein